MVVFSPKASSNQHLGHSGNSKPVNPFPFWKLQAVWELGHRSSFSSALLQLRKKCDASYLLCPEHSKLKWAPCSHMWQRSRVPKQLWLLHITHVNIWGWSSSTALKLPGFVFHTCDVCALTQAQLSKCTVHVAPQVCVLVLATDECLHWEILTLLCSEVHVRTGWQWEKQPVRKKSPSSFALALWKCLHSYSVCPLRCSEIQVHDKKSFSNGWMTNEEHDDNIYILQHRSFSLRDDWRQMAIVA